SPVRSLVRSGDGKWIALGLENGQIRLVDAASGSAVRTLEGQHAAAVTGLAATQSGERLVSVSLDKHLVVWNVADGKVHAKFEAPAALQGVVLVADDQQVVAG